VVAAKLLLLVILANGAPLALTLFLGQRWARPLDSGVRFLDGRPLLGESKTLRGIVAGIAVPTALAPLVGLEPEVGLTVGTLAMLGDLVSSFVKRRWALDPNANAPLLDQLPEALFPLLAVRVQLGISWPTLLALVTIFVVIDLAMTPMVRVLRRWVGVTRS
jgi:hypothetical protein